MVDGPFNDLDHTRSTGSLPRVQGLRWRIARASELLIATVLLWSAVAKAVAPHDAAVFIIKVFHQHHPSPLILIVVLAEWGIGSALLLRWTPQRAMFMATLLLAAFTSLLLYARATGFQGTCGCLGGVRMTMGQALVRNGALLIVCVLAIALSSPARAQREPYTSGFFRRRTA